MRRLYVLLAILALVAILHSAFPYVLQDEDARMRVLYLVMLLAFVLGGGSKALRNRPWPKAARDAAIWVGILLLLVLAFSFKGDFMHSRIMAELMPSTAQSNGDGTYTIKAAEDGHFYVDANVNGGTQVRFLIDTGASDIVLTPDDAQRAGLEPDTLHYDRPFYSANGGGMSASAELSSLQIGGIMLDKMHVSVNKAWMKESLLGMHFLRQLKGFHIEGDRLVLIP